MTIRTERKCKWLIGVAAGFAMTVAPLTMAADSPAAPTPAPAPTPDTARAQTQQALADAQRELAEAAREVAELSSRLGADVGERVSRFLAGSPRAMLGIQLAAAGDAKGAPIAAVSPGGAAEQAGIKAGDVITAIGGAEVPEGQGASRAVVQRMRELQPGLKVKVAVLREGKKMEFDVTPRAAPALAFGGGGGRAGGDADSDGRRAQREGARGSQRDLPNFELNFGNGTRFAGMEFATLSERLGSYFGVKSGVLVVRAGAAENSWKLQDGDVILSIDGRAPTSAAHASRILRTYQSGEKVKLRVQRDRRAQDIDVTVAGGRDQGGARR